MLEIKRLAPDLAAPLASLFQGLANAGTQEFFHPHPLTEAEAQRICSYEGHDCYYAIVDGQTVLGYGMLRGWDAGYDVPSLGIALASEARGLGLGELFMHFLHAAARHHGARSVRLKVYQTNHPAVNLYKRLGYQLSPCSADELLGILTL